MTRLTARPGGFHWERQVAAGLLVWIHQNAGDLVRSRAEGLAFLDEAHERGDVYGRVLFSQYVAYAAVARGELAECRTLTRWICEDWARGAFTIPCYYATMVEVLADLYEGDADAAFERWTSIQAGFRAGGGDYAAPTVIDNALFGARVHLAKGLDARSTRALVKSAARLDGLPRRDGPAIAEWIRAVVAADGTTPAGLAALGRAGDKLVEAGLGMHGRCVLRHVAVRRGDAGARAEIDAWLTAHGAADPARWAAAFMPAEASPSGRGTASPTTRSLPAPA